MLGDWYMCKKNQHQLGTGQAYECRYTTACHNTKMNARLATIQPALHKHLYPSQARHMLHLYTLNSTTQHFNTQPCVWHNSRPAYTPQSPAVTPPSKQSAVEVLEGWGVPVGCGITGALQPRSHHHIGHHTHTHHLGAAAAACVEDPAATRAEEPPGPCCQPVKGHQVAAHLEQLWNDAAAGSSKHSMQQFWCVSGA